MLGVYGLRVGEQNNSHCPCGPRFNYATGINSFHRKYTSKPQNENEIAKRLLTTKYNTQYYLIHDICTVTKHAVFTNTICSDHCTLNNESVQISFQAVKLSSSYLIIAI